MIFNSNIAIIIQDNNKSEIVIGHDVENDKFLEGGGSVEGQLNVQRRAKLILARRPLTEEYASNNIFRSSKSFDRRSLHEPLSQEYFADKLFTSFKSWNIPSLLSTERKSTIIHQSLEGVLTLRESKDKTSEPTVNNLLRLQKVTHPYLRRCASVDSEEFILLYPTKTEAAKTRGLKVTNLFNFASNCSTFGENDEEELYKVPRNLDAEISKMIGKNSAAVVSLGKIKLIF